MDKPSVLRHGGSEFTTPRGGWLECNTKISNTRPLSPCLNIGISSISESVCHNNQVENSISQYHCIEVIYFAFLKVIYFIKILKRLLTSNLIYHFYGSESP